MFKRRKVQVARVATVMAVSLALAFTAGCSRDPNVRKQKYLASGKRYVVAQTVDQVGAAASGGYGYVLAAGASAGACTLHVFAPGCAGPP